MNRDDRSAIPSVTRISNLLIRKRLVSSEQRANTIARSIQDAIRERFLHDPSTSASAELARQVGEFSGLLHRSRYTPVVNGTGILVHTNLGRAPVSDETAEAMSQAAAGAVALEVEAETGRRGGRMREITRLLALLTGCEAALVVNNNAAAVLLTLSALVSGKRVAISRAEAVEIGGGFRIPDVMQQSGATLVEVGTTNRTYASDYLKAVTSGDSAILKVHSSNFAISGFVARPSLEELRDVAMSRGALLIEDLGSGTLADTANYGMDHEPTIQESIQAGVDVVTFSGDKLLGGPQAGIVAGKSNLVERIEKSPLARAIRADKTTLAGVAATLRHYLRGDAESAIPVIRMMGWDRDELRQRAEAIVARLGAPAVQVGVVETTNYVGGGSLPGQSLPGVAIAVTPRSASVETLAKTLRLGTPTAVYGRIDNDRLLIELRTVLPRDDGALSDALIAAVS